MKLRMMNVFFYFDFLRFSSCAVFTYSLYEFHVNISTFDTDLFHTARRHTGESSGRRRRRRVGSPIYQVKVVLVPPDKGDLLILSIH